MSPVGLSAAIDPIDGTWAYINRFDSIASSLLFTKDGKPHLGMVLNPSTGEIAYGGYNIGGRLIQFSLFGEPDKATNLPMDKGNPASRLINVHPRRIDFGLLEHIRDLWKKRVIHFVRSPGGSPSLSLLETAKGSSNYINLWTQKAAKPYDLAAATLLLRSAGGEVFDTQGLPINPLNHSGPFFAINKNDIHSSIPRLLTESLSRVT